LQKIETECNAILLDMVKDMKKSLRHWSGQDNSVSILETMSEDNDGSLNAGSFDSLDESENLYEPPKSLADIFECAGTLVLLMKERHIAGLDPGVTLLDCERMSIVAATRLLDRVLDTHQLEVQEAAMDSAVLSTSAEEGADFERPTFHLIPTHVLDGGILQTAALFRRSFKDYKDIQTQDFSDGPDHLEAFVEDAYGSFLSHVKSVLLEHARGTQTSQESQNSGQEADGNEGYVDIAGAMSTLLVSVRELASALSSPEIGIRPEVASGLVERAADLSDTLVRGRVDRLLCELRLRVVNDCLGPLAERIAAEKDEEADASAVLPHTTQVVQIAVSDCMQLLDDTIRSIVSGRDDLGASIDLPALKQSIQASTSRFAAWLAGSLEVLAGCDASDPYFSFEATVPSMAPGDSGVPGIVPCGLLNDGNEYVGELSSQFETLNAKVNDALQGVATTLDRKSAGLKSCDVVLQLLEMCRNCESSIVDAMRQSIETKVGGGKKGRSSGLFPIDKKNVALSPYEKSSAVRFRLAGSRILALYCGNRGFEAAHHLCSAPNNESDLKQYPDGPSAGACLALDIAKQVSVDCSKLFRDEKPRRPLPDFSSLSAVSQPMLGRITSQVKGLQLDVERMFQEKISIFPHPSEELEFSRDAVLTLFFFVMIKAAAEQARQWSFSVTGYTRLLVDMEFLREMIPHYVNEKYEVHGSKACSALSSQCSDTVNNARDRCQDQDIPENDILLIRRAREALKGYMMTRDADHSFTLT
jgi:vacuolar protein sorting-associated protein 51